MFKTTGTYFLHFFAKNGHDIIYRSVVFKNIAAVKKRKNRNFSGEYFRKPLSLHCQNCNLILFVKSNTRTRFFVTAVP